MRVIRQLIDIQLDRGRLTTDQVDALRSMGFIDPPPDIATVLGTDIGDMDLTVRTYNALRRERVRTVGDLVNLVDLTESDALGFLAILPKCLDEVRTKLRVLGLSLAAAGGPGHVSDDDSADTWDAHADLPLRSARRKTRSRRGRPVGIVEKLKRSIAGQREFIDTACIVAQRVRQGVDMHPQEALRSLVSADADELDWVLMWDDLWATLWRHLTAGDIMSELTESEQRRFANLLAAQDHTRTPTQRDPDAAAILGLSVAAIEAHRVLRSAFVRIAEAIHPARAVAELDLVNNTVAYEALIILHNAGRTWRTVADLPRLDPGVGLPRPRAAIDTEAGRPADGSDQRLRLLLPFQPGWDAAVRIDPVRVLPYMHWCTQRWSRQAGCDAEAVWVLNVDGRRHLGRSDPERAGVWFASTAVGRRRLTVVWEDTGSVVGTCGREVSLTVNGQRFVLDRSDHGDATYNRWPRSLTFSQPDGNQTDGTTSVTVQGWSGSRTWIRYWPVGPRVPLPPPRGDVVYAAPATYGLLWAAGLVDLPLLTCPIEWEDA